MNLFYREDQTTGEECHNEKKSSTISSTTNHQYLFSSTMSTVLTSNYLDLNDMDLLSDDSFDQDELVLEVDDKYKSDEDEEKNENRCLELLSVETTTKEKSDSAKNVSFISPPPKPVRTFEHDLYVIGKHNEQRRPVETRTERTQSLDLSGNFTSRGGCEHIYETLPSVDQLSLQDTSNSGEDVLFAGEKYTDSINFKRFSFNFNKLIASNNEASVRKFNKKNNSNVRRIF